MARLDAFLKNTGLVKQRSEAKRACDAGCVRVDGQLAKASHLVAVGQTIEAEVGHSRWTAEVLRVPERPVPRAQRQECYRLTEQESIDPYADLEF